ncbi:hypothetical protein BHM03_00026347 [Ensete ventricosum]|nr:hypothetical protein BHM03_00026347 [Ensete ventricosum]
MMHLCRLYTGIHALKPKPKCQPGISESTTALNVDQANVVSGGQMPLLSAPSTVPAEVPVQNARDENVVPVLPTESANVGASAAAQKTEGMVAVKAQVDRRKMDARKKSLKRL